MDYHVGKRIVSFIFVRKVCALNLFRTDSPANSNFPAVLKISLFPVSHVPEFINTLNFKLTRLKKG